MEKIYKKFNENKNWLLNGKKIFNLMCSDIFKLTKTAVFFFKKKGCHLELLFI